MEALPFVAWRAFIAGAALLIASLLGTRVGGTSRLPNPSVLSAMRRALLFAALCRRLNIALFAAYLGTAVGSR